jgi:hypothetical protein
MCGIKEEQTMDEKKLEIIKEIISSAKELSVAVTRFDVSLTKLNNTGVKNDQLITLLQILDPESVEVINQAINFTTPTSKPVSTTVKEEPNQVKKSEPSINTTRSSGIARKPIKVEGYTFGKVEVSTDGHVYVNGVVCHAFLNTTGYWMVQLPTADGHPKNILCHKLVAKAFMKPMPKSNDSIVHKNRNPKDCRLSNLAWSSEYKSSNPEFDESVAVVICEELVKNKMDPANALRGCINRKVYTTTTRVQQVLRKEAYVDISDKYFDEKGHPITKSAPKNLTKEELDQRENMIKETLKKCGGRISDAAERLKNVGITMYEVFNVKHRDSGKPPVADIYAIIRYARASGTDDIAMTLLNECALQVSHHQIVAATRVK